MINKKFKFYIKKITITLLTINFLCVPVVAQEEKIDAISGATDSWGGYFSRGDMYKNIKKNELTQSQEFYGKRFLVKDQLLKIEWNLGTETKTIGNYTCYKATLVKEDTNVDWGSIFSRRGSNKKKDSAKTEDKISDKKMLIVTAWYTPQIPVSSGPDKYWGLPGLILELNAGRMTMLCTEVSISSDKTLVINEPKKGKKVSREEYTSIVKEKTEELKQRFQNRRSGGRRK